MKKTFAFLGGLCTGIWLVMVWLHKELIVAAIKGEKLPEPPESCPAYQKK